MLSGKGAEGLLVVKWIPAGHGAHACRGGVEPVLHVILLGHSGGAGITHVVPTQVVFHFARRVRVDQEEAPPFGCRRAVRMPGAQAARLSSMVGGVREDRADEGHKPRLRAKAPFTLLEAMAEVLLQYGIIEE